MSELPTGELGDVAYILHYLSLQDNDWCEGEVDYLLRLLLLLLPVLGKQCSGNPNN